MAETTFYQKFAVNMDLLGLPAPHSLFESAVTATGTIQSLARAVKPLARVSRSASCSGQSQGFASAAALADFATLAVGMTAAFYLAACAGSFVMATGQTLSTSSFAATLTTPLRTTPAVWM
jgi:hypothetical protein